MLGDSERCVTEIARDVGLSQSCTTRHLQALARHGLVRRRRAGKRVLFTLDPREPLIRELLEWAASAGGGAVAPERRPSAPPSDPRAGPTPGPPPATVAGPAEESLEKPGPSSGVRRAPLRPGDLEDYLL
jgi:hypothetical protein